MNEPTEAGIAEVPVAEMSDTGHPSGEITHATWWERNEPIILGMGFIVVFLLIWEAIPLIFTLSKGLQLFFTAPSNISMALYSMFSGDTRCSCTATFGMHCRTAPMRSRSGLALV